MAKSPFYRFYFLDGLSISSVTTVQCASDKDARDFAQRLTTSSALEIWDGGRKVYRNAASGSEADDPTVVPSAAHRRQPFSHSDRTVRQLIRESKAAIAESRECLKRPFASAGAPDKLWQPC